MTKPFTLRVLLQGAMIGTLTLIAYRIGLETSTEAARTMTFAVLALTQVMHLLMYARKGLLPSEECLATAIC